MAAPTAEMLRFRLTLDVGAEGRGVVEVVHALRMPTIGSA